MLEIGLYLILCICSGIFIGTLLFLAWVMLMSRSFFVKGCNLYASRGWAITKHNLFFPTTQTISPHTNEQYIKMWTELKNKNITWKTLKRLTGNAIIDNYEAFVVRSWLKDVLHLAGVTNDYSELLFKTNQGITIIVTTQEEYNNNFLKPLLNGEYDKLLHEPAKYITRMIKQAHLAGKLDVYNDLEEDNPIIITIAPTKEHWESAHFATYTLDKKAVKPENPQFQKEIKRILAEDHSDLIEQLYTGQSIMKKNLHHIGSLWI